MENCDIKDRSFLRDGEGRLVGFWGAAPKKLTKRGGQAKIYGVFIN